MSDIPEGYKMSEVCVIPEDWDVKELGEKTTKIGSGITPTGGEKVYKSEGRPFLRSQNVGWGYLILEDIAFIDDEIHNTFKATEIERNDVFLNITGASIGRSALADERVQNGNVNQHVCIIRAIEGELYPKFLNYFLLSKNGQKQIDSFQAGGNRQGLNFGQIKSFKIPLPPLPEQQAIASALSDVDALITALEQLITKKRNIKQGAMQQLLTGEKRLPGFDGEWEVKELKTVVKDFIVPMRDKPKSFKGDIPWCRIEDFDGKYLIGTKSGQYVNDGIVKEMNLKIHPMGTLLVSCSADLGRCAIVKRPLTTNQTFIGLVINELKLSNEFLYYYMTFNAEELNNLSSGTTISYLSREQFEIFKIYIPPTESEQQAIAKILSDMDTEIEALKQKQDKYKAIKQGMMQELLTGKTRLV